MGQICLIVGDTVFMPHRTHQEVLDQWKLRHPIEELRHVVTNEHQAAEWDPCMVAARLGVFHCAKG